MRRSKRLLAILVSTLAACQNDCNPDCLTGAETSVSRFPSALGDEGPETCGGVEGLRLVLETVPGNTDFAPIGSLAQPGPTVQLLTALLRTPVVDVPVVFTITGGGGKFDTINPTDQTFTILTDENGRASIPNWRMGTAPGANTVTAHVDAEALNASISNTPQTFLITATPAAAIAIQNGNNQTAAVGARLSTDPEVIVTDGSGRPVQGLPVTFAITGGGGILFTSGDRHTDFFGRARIGWILGTGAGTNTLTVTAAEAGLLGNPVTFQAIAVAGPAHTLSLHVGNNQSALRSTAVAVRPAVRLVDQHQNPVPGVPVTFTPVSGGGSVQGSPATTDANGVATVGGWTLGQTAGENRLSAEAPGAGIIGNPAQFVATGTRPVAANVVAFAGAGQSGTVGTLLPVRPAIRVTDANGNPVDGEPVLFLLSSSPGFVTGSITGTSQTTDANGVATLGGWTLANQAGNNRLLATVLTADVNGDPVSFTATGLAGAPVTMTKVAGDNQSAPPNHSPEVVPTVRLADAHNNPVPGITVTFVVTSGGGEILNSVVTTNALGRASVGAWILGPAQGSNTLRATASPSGITGNPATFTATAIIPSLRAPPR